MTNPLDSLWRHCSSRPLIPNRKTATNPLDSLWQHCSSRPLTPCWLFVCIAYFLSLQYILLCQELPYSRGTGHKTDSLMRKLIFKKAGTLNVQPMFQFLCWIHRQRRSATKKWMKELKDIMPKRRKASLICQRGKINETRSSGQVLTVKLPTYSSKKPKSNEKKFMALAKTKAMVGIIPDK